MSRQIGIQETEAQSPLRLRNLTDGIVIWLPANIKIALLCCNYIDVPFLGGSSSFLVMVTFSSVIIFFFWTSITLKTVNVEILPCRMQCAI